MNKTIISVITLVVFISVTGYATERYEANMRERQAGTGTPTMIKKQEAVSMSQNSNNLYPSSYRALLCKYGSSLNEEAGGYLHVTGSE